jgi:hydrogenase maturation protease
VSSSLVLGLGNRLSGADAFGPAVIEWLRGAVDLPLSVQLVDAHTDLLAYIDRFAHYDHVILVDTVLATSRHGIAVFDEKTFSAWEDRFTGAHELSPLTVVKLFRRLNAGPERAGLHGSGLSGPAAGAQSPGLPEITLVAHVVRDDDFRRAPTQSEIAAGAAAVRRVLSAHVPTMPLGSLPSLI